MTAPTHGVKISRGTVTHWNDVPITSRDEATQAMLAIEKLTGERGETTKLYARLPLQLEATAE